MTRMIRFERLRIEVGRRLLLEDGRLELEAGRCLLLTGPNGAGKSTLLRVAAGLEAPGRAIVTADGWETTWRRARRTLLRQVVYVHQSPYLFDRSVAANVAYGLAARRLPRELIRERVEEALEWAGLAHLAGRPARQLSGGERQRVAITRARVCRPRYLLLDEPTASLDTEGRESTYFLIHRLLAEGVGVIVASHDQQTNQILGDTTLRLEGGRLRPAPGGGRRSALAPAGQRKA